MPETIRQVLFRATEILKKHGTDTPELDAQALLCHCLSVPRAFLFTHPEHVLTPDQARLFDALVQRRNDREPVAYITGEKEFWSRSFACNRSTLVPRPETELIIETALAWFQDSSIRPAHILDLGTGTGCIGITFALEFPGAHVVLTDKSLAALRVARVNVLRMLKNQNMACLLCADWFDAFAETARFDLIAANPPYISPADKSMLPQDVVRFEPDLALFDRNDGYAAIRTIFSKAWKHLSSGGLVICETGWDQASNTVDFVIATGRYSRVFVRKDLSGHERIVAATV